MWADINRYQQQVWGHTLATMVREYGVLVDAQFELARKAFHATTATLTPVSKAARAPDKGKTPAGDSGALMVDVIDRRVRAGFSPPAEAHLVQNRHKVDWSKYPTWARPADPDMFEGCGHEG